MALIKGTSGVDDLGGGGAPDVILGFAGDDTLDGGHGDDIIYGGAGNDTLTGGMGVDTLIGGGGNDLIVLAGGDDVAAGERYAGGAGVDTLVIHGLADLSLTSIGASVEQITTDGASLWMTAAQLSGFASITGNILRVTDRGVVDLSHTILNATSIHLSDAGGVVILPQDDYPLYFNVTGAGGADVVHGGNGDDRFSGRGGDDVMTGGGGADAIWGGAGADRISGGDGRDFLLGDDGDDSISGGVDNDFLFGGRGDDTLSGGGGNDTFFGGAGFNVLDGGSGDDTFTIERPEDLVDTQFIGGEGFDFLSLGPRTVDISNVAISEIEAVSSSGDVSMSGAQLEDFSRLYMRGSVTLTTGAHADLDGERIMVDGFNLSDAGNALILPFQMITGLSLYVRGGAGDDTVSIGSAATVDPYGSGGAGPASFSLFGRGGQDSLSGGERGDRLYGGPGFDTLSGGGGDDLLTGGRDADTLAGGTGADTFAFRSMADSAPGLAIDRILDFHHAEADCIDLSAISTTLAYVDAAAFDGLGAGEVRVEAHGPDQLLQVDADGDGVSDMDVYLVGSGVTGAADLVL